MLRVGFVSVIRPLFKGDSPAAARRSLDGLRALGRQEGFEVITPEVTGNEPHAASGEALPPFAVSTPAAAEQAAEQLRARALDMLLIQHTTFSTGDLLVPLLHVAKRVGVWALPEEAGGMGERGPLPLNALCGLNMTLSFLDRPEVRKEGPVKWFYGEVTSPGFRERWQPTVAALKGLKAVEGARVLQLGGTAPGFYGIGEMPALAGVEVETKPLGELFSRVSRVGEEDATALARHWAKLEPTDVDEAQLTRAARLTLALRSLAEEGGFQALAVRCWPEVPDTCGTMACASLGRLADGELPASCEGDVMGALSMLALQGITGRSSILMDLSDLDAEADALQFWHCGNAALGWASRAATRLTTHFNRDGLGVVRDMTLREGEATGFRLLAGGKRALVFAGRFLGDAKPGFDGVRGWLKALRWAGVPASAEAFVHNVLEHRLPHHFAFGEGACEEALLELCGWLGAEALPFRPPRPTL
jgi:L-fucose isomerase-like protein